MASFQPRPATGMRRRTAILCALLVASSPSSHSFRLPHGAALAFSPRHAVALPSPSCLPSITTRIASLEGKGGDRRRTEVRLFSRSLSSALNSKPRRHDIDVDLTASPGDSSQEIARERRESSLKEDIQSISTLLGAQALLLPLSALLAKILNIPNVGLGLGFDLNVHAAILGFQWTIPLFAIAGIMRLIEPYSSALQGVTKATQRSVLAVMGKQRRPMFALLVSILLGSVAGWGEEWLFRGVFQTYLGESFSRGIALTVSGIVFGLLHAVTPIYALLAGAASVFFGYLYNQTENLAVPMICHAVYDIGALMWAHWSVTALTRNEQNEILDSGPGAPIMNLGALKSAG